MERSELGLRPLSHADRGAIEALELCGTEQQKALYVPRLISGEWTGTMNLTEPQAGSDLSAVRTRSLIRTSSSEACRRDRVQCSPGVNINSRLSLCSRAAMTA